tara:strand:+ start:1201 stop:4530 length:3330 start_codon:yes stop_codon:yes gene_type:complete
MNNNAWFKKENPLLSLQSMSGGAAGSLMQGAAAEKKYIDDLFSNYVYYGNAAGSDETTNIIGNGIKLGNANAGNSVSLDGSNDYLIVPSSSDFAFGTGDFTWEGWFYLQDDGSYLISFGADVGNIDYYTYGGVTRRLRYYNSVASHQEITDTVLSLRQWYHIAAARSSNTTKLFLDGTEKLSFTDNKDYGAEALYLGATSVGGSLLTGNISNVRIVKGTALYTSSFTPSTTALKSVTNTKLLCCNGSHYSSATVTPNTITAGGAPLGTSFGPYTADDAKGGMVWIKHRASHFSSGEHYIADTVRGATKWISSSTNTAESTDPTTDGGFGLGGLSSFNNGGFTLNGQGYGGYTNYIQGGTGAVYGSWTFAKQEKFFDIVTWTGTGSYRTLDHNLGCIPGFIMLKKTSGSENWVCWQRSFASANYIKLNNHHPMGTDGGGGSNPNASVNSVSSTQFTVGADNNGSGGTWVAYLFAGGAATQQYSVKTNAGNSNYMSVPAHSDLELDSDFTVEFWHKRTTTGTTALFAYGDASAAGGSGIEWYYNGSNVQKLYVNNTEYEFPDGTQAPAYKWVHYAICREGTNTRIFVDGELMTTYASHSATIVGPIITGNYWGAGVSATDGAYWSNLRVVKGTAVYTSDFTPPQSALTNITNTKLLCWNSSTTTGATVSPVTIVQNGTVTSEWDTPSYSDPDCFAFGEGEDKNIVATGIYDGNGASDGPEIDLGWEPSWLLIRNLTGSNRDWKMLDSTRGIGMDSYDQVLISNTNSTEATAEDVVDLTSTGFKITSSNAHYNENGERIMYFAIRREDGYVGKAPAEGTDAFSMDVGNASSIIPNFDSGFPLDFALVKKPATVQDWYTGARLTANRYMNTNTTTAEGVSSEYVFDSNVGWMKGTANSSVYQSWMWKRGQGCDVVTYSGTGLAGQKIRHNLSTAPEMIWLKKRSAVGEWTVGHAGVNSGVNPWEYELLLEEYYAQSDQSGKFNDTAPSSTHFTIGNSTWVNSGSDTYLAVLFASITGISKCGYYSGSGGAQTITTGFQPRFVIIKRTDAAASWFVFDSLRGWSSGADPYLLLDSTAAQDGAYDMGSAESNGFSLINDTNTNASGGSYIYYAHA